MTPAARLSAAMSILDEWRGGRPVEQALTRWARGARYAGSKDRAAVRDVVFDALRQMGSAALAGGGEDGRALVLGLSRLRGEDPEALFTGEGHAPERLSDVERTLVASPLPPPDPERDVPGWLRAEIGARAPDAPSRAALFAALSRRAPVWLRVALRRGGREAARKSLAADGIETRPDPGCETALEVTAGARALRGSRAYRDGLVEVQDLSPQRAVAAVPWPGQGRILDFCAGGGGKALAIADRTEARILAHDAVARRMTDLPARAARAGIDIACLAPGAAARGGPYDAVLVDVPCSGSGTWRRDPEAKWRLDPARLDALCQAQAGILDAAQALVRPGGLLVYMTCSLLPRENEGQIDAFRERRSEWRLAATRLDTPLTASDGFYTAVLDRG
jgi:16S rRNA (cytosine967-C5)-methyltransferase